MTLPLEQKIYQPHFNLLTIVLIFEKNDTAALAKEIMSIKAYGG